jgi:uncharacterized membrane protein YgcG
VTKIDELVDGARSFEPALREPLVADGLLVADAKALQLKAMLPALIWCGVGAIKMMVGVSRGKPVGFLVVLAIVLFVTALAATKAPRRTKAGDDLVEQTKLRYAALETTAATAPLQLSGQDMTLAYAMFGAAILAPALVSSMPSYQRSLAESMSVASSGGSSCGSSCGGGCGGGCGGCS